MGKNLIICADGTGNEGGTVDESNVFRLYRLLTDEEAENAYYDQGLGTEKLPLLGKAFGMGISKNIRDCYEFLVEHHEKGDSIFLFGFSRGAFTVRSLAGMIAHCGLLQPRYRVLVAQAYRLYKKAKKNPEAARRFKRTFATNAHIKFIGVWDTVGALGTRIRWLDNLNPFGHRFHNTTLSPDTAFAYHALSVDDKRRTFHPTLWKQPGVEGQTIEQVWFPGVHADVGGGYDNHDLSDIALEWMMHKAHDCGLQFISGCEYCIGADPTGKMHDSRSGWGWIYVKKVRNIQRISKRYGIEVPLIHDSVEVRGKAPACNYQPKNLPPSYTTAVSKPADFD